MLDLAVRQLVKRYRQKTRELDQSSKSRASRLYIRLGSVLLWLYSVVQHRWCRRITVIYL